MLCSAAAQDQLEARAPRDPAGRGGGGDREAEAHAIGAAQRRRLPLVDDDEGRVEIVDGERAVDVGAAEPERARRAQEMRERRGRRTKNVGASGSVAATAPPSQKRTWKGREGNTRATPG